MDIYLLVIHVVIAALIIGLVLLQHGKGAEVGASFGSGASNTIFGSKGSGSFLAKATVILAVLFAATSIGLTKLTSYVVKSDVIDVDSIEKSSTTTVDRKVPMGNNNVISDPLLDQPPIFSKKTNNGVSSSNTSNIKKGNDIPE